MTMNSATDFLFNQHDSLLNTFLPLFEGIVLQMCYISRFTLLRVLAYNKQRGLHRTLSLSLDNLPVLIVILRTVGFGLAKDCEVTIIGKGVRHRTSTRMSMGKQPFH